MSTNLDLHSTSFSKRFILKQLLVNFTKSQPSQNNVGLIEWKNSILKSTDLNVNGTTTVYALTTLTNFQAEINNTILQRTLDVSQNINMVNFTLNSVILGIKVETSNQFIPIENAVIKGNQSVLGLTNNLGIFTDRMTPGSYDLAIYYGSFSYNLSIQIFENQMHTIELPIYSNLTIAIQSNDLSPAEYISVNLYSSN